MAARAGVGGLTIETVAGALVARLNADADSSVRAAICETLGRLPYASGEQVRHAEIIDAHNRAADQKCQLGNFVDEHERQTGYKPT